MYIIQNLINMGYWDQNNKSFRGINYASTFFTKSSAINEIIKLKKSYPFLTIVEMF